MAKQQNVYKLIRLDNEEIRVIAQSLSEQAASINILRAQLGGANNSATRAQLADYRRVARVLDNRADTLQRIANRINVAPLQFSSIDKTLRGGR